MGSGELNLNSTGKEEQSIYKEPVIEKLNREDTSVFHKYTQIFVGKGGLLDFVLYEVVMTFLSPLPGAVGLLLRRLFFPFLFQEIGRNVAWGSNIALRHPGRMRIGDRCAIDDNCLLDARGAGDEGLQIGNEVLIARDTIIQCKTGPILIGEGCTIGSQTQFSSVSGIILGRAVMVGGQCYLGGGRYHYDSRSRYIKDQGLYSKGPVIIEDDVWIGAGVTILDGVHIGRGSVIGSGAVIREDLPAFTVVNPYQKLVMLPRGG